MVLGWGNPGLTGPVRFQGSWTAGSGPGLTRPVRGPTRRGRRSGRPGPAAAEAADPGQVVQSRGPEVTRPGTSG